MNSKKLSSIVWSRSVVLYALPGTLTALCALAVFVLVLGWSITPAQAHGSADNCLHKDDTHKHCNENPTPDDDGGGPIPMRVTIDDADGDGLRTDDERDYIDKVDKVVALIRSTAGQGKGNFVMHLSKFAIRKLFLDFRNCTSGDNTCIPPFVTGLTVGPTSIFTSGIDLTTMTDDQFRGDLSMSVNINDGGTWSLFFGSNDENCEGSSTIGVTRIDTDTWVIEAGGDDRGLSRERCGGR